MKICKYGHERDDAIVSCNTCAQIYRKRLDVIEKKKLKKQTEEYKNYAREYSRQYRLSGKAFISRKKPENIARQKAYSQTPERKAYDKARKQKPEAKERLRALAQTPERKAKRIAYQKANLNKYSAIAAKRRAAKLQRTPSWLTKDCLKEIESLYAEAKRLELIDGIPRHVDHIYPLQGKNVSGLHVPSNLQILTAFENMSKGSKKPD